MVSLPSYHQGGQLVVGNAGQSLVFDWSRTDKTRPAEIKWAAFYSDRQHEVHEVTSGHRITLTYNLFLTRGNGHLAGASSALDCTQLPLYKHLEEALENPRFFHRGIFLSLTRVLSRKMIFPRPCSRGLLNSRLRPHERAHQLSSSLAERSGHGFVEYCENTRIEVPRRAHDGK